MEMREGSLSPCGTLSKAEGSRAQTVCDEMTLRQEGGWGVHNRARGPAWLAWTEWWGTVGDELGREQR